MHAGGIGVVLATPTASPPPWLGHLHPDTLPRDEDGRTEWWGGRQHLSHSGATYRRHARRHHRGPGRPPRRPSRPHHVDINEYCTYDHGDEAATRFRRWLQDRYGTLDALNTARCTAFWSQGYGDWAGGPAGPPHPLPEEPDPGPRLPALHLRHAPGVLRRRTRHRPPPHPAPAGDHQLHAALVPARTPGAGPRRRTSSPSTSTPGPRDSFGAQEGALVQDMTRSQAWPVDVMEQAAGPVNWRGVNHPKPRGLNRHGSLQAVARGADAVCYSSGASRGRAPRSSTPMVSMRGRKAVRTRRSSSSAPTSRSSARTAADSTSPPTSPSCTTGTPGGPAPRTAASPPASTTPTSSRLAPRTAGSPPHHRLRPPGTRPDPVQGGRRTSSTRSPTRRSTTSSPTRAVAAPSSAASHRRRRRGRPGQARRHGRPAARAVRHPHPARVVAPGDGRDGRLRRLRRTLWLEEIEPDGTATETVRYRAASWTDSRPSCARAAPGTFRPSRSWTRCAQRLARIAADAGARPVLDGLPARVEAVRRGDLLFLLHHGRDPVTVDVPGTHRDLLTDATVTDRVTLGRYGVAVLAEPASRPVRRRTAPGSPSPPPAGRTPS